MPRGCLHLEITPKKPPNVVCLAFYRACQEMLRTHCKARNLARCQASQPLLVVVVSTWQGARSRAVSKARPQCRRRGISPTRLPVTYILPIICSHLSFSLSLENTSETHCNALPTDPLMEEGVPLNVILSQVWTNWTDQT